MKLKNCLAFGESSPKRLRLGASNQQGAKKAFYNGLFLPDPKIDMKYRRKRMVHLNDRKYPVIDFLTAGFFLDKLLTFFKIIDTIIVPMRGRSL